MFGLPKDGENEMDLKSDTRRERERERQSERSMLL